MINIVKKIYILLFILFLFSCGKEPADLVFDNPYDPLSPNYAGKNNGQTQLPTSITGKDGAPMKLIPAGDFQMGSNDGNDDEKPIHTVYIDAFYMDNYEVTNAQYKKFMDATGHKEPEGYGVTNGNWQFKPWSDPNFKGDDQPVVCINQEDAKSYCQWAGKRLPTEAEWEKAARGGVTGKKYVWGDEFPPSKNAGNFADISAKKVFTNWTPLDGYDDGHTYTAPVGSFKPNGYGLYDMAGNVWEWCADWYDSHYYATSPKSNPAGSVSGSMSILRGGSWYQFLNLTYLRVAFRGSSVPTATNSELGFRCAMDVPK
jgi:formylglycine-generating enzyme